MQLNPVQNAQYAVDARTYTLSTYINFFRSIIYWSLNNTMTSSGHLCYLGIGMTGVAASLFLASLAMRVSLIYLKSSKDQNTTMHKVNRFLSDKVYLLNILLVVADVLMIRHTLKVGGRLI